MAYLKYRIYNKPKNSKGPWRFITSHPTKSSAEAAVKMMSYDGMNKWALKDGPPSDRWLSGKR